ncbi:pyridoxal-phosphate dependent enzyme [Vibrio sp. PP-XX7]
MKKVHDGGPEVFVKNDTELPSGSLKDRASFLSIIKALEYKFNKICVASTGNAAASLSCLCAMAGLKSIVYVPSTMPKNKLIQNLIYGSEVHMVNGDYDEAL